MFQCVFDRLNLRRFMYILLVLVHSFALGGESDLKQEKPERLSLGGIAAATTKGAKRIVFDIDDTLCKRLGYAGKYRGVIYMNMPGSVVIPFYDQNTHYPHVFFPEFGEVFLQILQWGWDVDFFAAADKFRNETVIDRFLQSAFDPYSDDSESDLKKLKQGGRIRVFSRSDTVHTRVGGYEPSQYETFGQLKKDLSKLSDDLENIVLIDNDSSYAIGGKQYPMVPANISWVRIPNRSALYAATKRMGSSRFQFNEYAAYQLGVLGASKQLMDKEGITLRAAVTKVLTVSKKKEDLKKSGPCITDFQNIKSKQEVIENVSKCVEIGQGLIKKVKQQKLKHGFVDYFKQLSQKVYFRDVDDIFHERIKLAKPVLKMLVPGYQEGQELPDAIVNFFARLNSYEIEELSEPGSSLRDFISHIKGNPTALDIFKREEWLFTDVHARIQKFLETLAQVNPDKIDILLQIANAVTKKTGFFGGNIMHKLRGEDKSRLVVVLYDCREISGFCSKLCEYKVYDELANLLGVRVARGEKTHPESLIIKELTKENPYYKCKKLVKILRNSQLTPDYVWGLYNKVDSLEIVNFAGSWVADLEKIYLKVDMFKYLFAGQLSYEKTQTFKIVLKFCVQAIFNDMRKVKKSGRHKSNATANILSYFLKEVGMVDPVLVADEIEKLMACKDPSDPKHRELKTSQFANSADIEEALNQEYEPNKERAGLFKFMLRLTKNNRKKYYKYIDSKFEKSLDYNDIDNIFMALEYYDRFDATSILDCVVDDLFTKHMDGYCIGRILTLLFDMQCEKDCEKNQELVKSLTKLFPQDIEPEDIRANFKVFDEAKRESVERIVSRTAKLLHSKIASEEIQYVMRSIAKLSTYEADDIVDNLSALLEGKDYRTINGYLHLASIFPGFKTKEFYASIKELFDSGHEEVWEVASEFKEIKEPNKRAIIFNMLPKLLNKKSSVYLMRQAIGVLRNIETTNLSILFEWASALFTDKMDCSWRADIMDLVDKVPDLNRTQVQQIFKKGMIERGRRDFIKKVEKLAPETRLDILKLAMPLLASETSGYHMASIIKNITKVRNDRRKPTLDLYAKISAIKKGAENYYYLNDCDKFKLINCMPKEHMNMEFYGQVIRFFQGTSYYEFGAIYEAVTKLKYMQLYDVVNVVIEQAGDNLSDYDGYTRGHMLEETVKLKTEERVPVLALFVKIKAIGKKDKKLRCPLHNSPLFKLISMTPAEDRNVEFFHKIFSLFKDVSGVAWTAVYKAVFALDSSNIVQVINDTLLQIGDSLSELDGLKRAEAIKATAKNLAEKQVS